MLALLILTTHHENLIWDRPKSKLYGLDIVTARGEGIDGIPLSVISGHEYLFFGVYLHYCVPGDLIGFLFRELVEVFHLLTHGI